MKKATKQLGIKTGRHAGLGPTPLFNYYSNTILSQRTQKVSRAKAVQLSSSNYFDFD
jgi:hypothetical protein